MWLLASIARLQLLLGVVSSFWMLAVADKRILLDPEYSLHQRPPTQEGEPLLIQVLLWPQNTHLCAKDMLMFVCKGHVDICVNVLVQGTDPS